MAEREENIGDALEIGAGFLIPPVIEAFIPGRAGEDPIARDPDKFVQIDPTKQLGIAMASMGAGAILAFERVLKAVAEGRADDALVKSLARNFDADPSKLAKFRDLAVKKQDFAEAALEAAKTIPPKDIAGAKNIKSVRGFLKEAGDKELDIAKRSAKSAGTKFKNFAQKIGRELDTVTAGAPPIAGLIEDSVSKIPKINTPPSIPANKKLFSEIDDITNMTKGILEGSSTREDFIKKISRTMSSEGVSFKEFLSDEFVENLAREKFGIKDIPGVPKASAIKSTAKAAKSGLSKFASLAKKIPIGKAIVGGAGAALAASTIKNTFFPSDERVAEREAEEAALKLAEEREKAEQAIPAKSFVNKDSLGGGDSKDDKIDAQIRDLINDLSGAKAKRRK